MLDYKEIITYVFAIGAGQAVFLFFILWKKTENSFANKFFALTMIVFALDLLGGVIFLSGFIKYVPWILGLNSAFPYLYGPLVYLYVIFLIHKQESFTASNYLHFIPFVFIQIYGLLFFYFEGAEYQLGLLDYNIEQPWHIEIIGQLIPFHGTIYMIITVWVTTRYNKKIKAVFSSIENIDLSWLLYLVVGTGLIWLVVILAYLLNIIYGDQLQANMLIYIVISVFLYTFAFKSYKQAEIKPSPEVDDAGKSYKKSGLTEVRATELLDEIVDYMNIEKPYFDTKLSLSQLSDNLGISSHNISEVINTKLNQNFYDFINSYRVEEVKKLIEEDRDSVYSILAHGFEAGFSSKSAYYSAFKKFTGLTPAQYRKTSILKIAS
jgi:AraC-like DNA-binding protein